MTDSYIVVREPDGTQKKVRNFQQTVGANTVQLQAVTLIDPTDTTVANNPGAQISVLATTTIVLASNASRRGAKIYADPANTQIVYVKLGTTALVSNFPLNPGDSIDLNFGNSVYTGVVHAISPSGTQILNVMEL